MNEQRNPFGLDPDCRRCPALVACRGAVVHGSGRPDATVLIVGTAPGRHAADAGLPFTGDEAGRRMAWLLRTVGLADERPDGTLGLDCYLTNAVRCATPDGRAPRQAEREACADWLAEELLRVDPTVVVPVGSAAGQSVFELLLDEPFPGVREAHGAVWQAHGYRIHPIAHVLRLPAEELRATANRLVRIAAHARAEREDDGGALDADRAGRILFRFGLARALADRRARRSTAGGPETGEPWWVARMGSLARTLFAALRHVHLAPGVRPEVRFLGYRRGSVYVMPYDGARQAADLHDAVSFDPHPRGVFEYWLLHHHLWTPAESQRYEVIHREARLLSRFDPDVARALVPVGERRRLFPPRVELPEPGRRLSLAENGSGPSADLTVVLRDTAAEQPTLRIDRYRIGLSDGRVRYLDREERTCDPRTVPRAPHWHDDAEDGRYGEAANG